MTSTPIVHKRADIAGILTLFLIAVGLQWSGFGSVLQADAQAYVTSGVNLIRHGEFVNAFGIPELWFPPVFPTLIGLLSVGGRLDAFLMGRLISVASSTLLLVLTWRLGHDRLRSRMAGAAAALVLACNPLFQQQAAASLSQPLATACAMAAFVFWLRMPEETGPRNSVLFGLTIGLGYLVRPEILLLLPLLAVVDLVERRDDLRHVVLQYVSAGALFAMCAAPYVAYLHAHTGQLQLSNKGEVNLAAGRAEYYHMFREYIDPETLEMRFPAYPITPSSEAGRYLANVQKIGAGYSEIFRLPLGAPIVGFAVVGLIALWGGSERRVAYGLLAQFAYLAVVARYAVAASYLYMTLRRSRSSRDTDSSPSSERFDGPRRFRRRWSPRALDGWPWR